METQEQQPESEMSKELEKMKEIAEEELVPLMIGFNEACHRHLDREGYADKIIFPGRDAAYLGRLWKWAYPADEQIVENLPITRATLSGDEHFSKEDICNFIDGVGHVAVIDTGYMMTIPSHLRDLYYGINGVPKEFVPPEKISALGMTVMMPEQTVLKGHGYFDGYDSLPGDWVSRDFGTMLGLKSPFVVNMGGYNKTSLGVMIQDTIEPVLGGTQRRFTGVEKGRAIRAKPYPSDEEIGKQPLLSKVKKYSERFRCMLLPVATTVRSMVNSNSQENPELENIQKMNDKELVKFIKSKIIEADRKLKGTELIKQIRQLEDERGPVWDDLSEGLSEEEIANLKTQVKTWFV